MAITSKLRSGRVWWTVAAIAAFLYGTVTRMLPTEFISTVIGTVLYAYFTRSDRSGQPEQEPPK
jgi:hypothetical protein